MLIIFFYIKGIVNKEFALAGQAVNSVYYCDVLRRLRENVRRLRPELWRERTGCYITITRRLTFPFSTGNFFTKNNMTVVPHSPFFSVSPIENKTERLPFLHI
jgi:hypothetical protein